MITRYKYKHPSKTKPRVEQYWESKLNLLTIVHEIQGNDKILTKEDRLKAYNIQLKKVGDEATCTTSCCRLIVYKNDLCYLCSTIKKLKKQ